MPAILDIGDDYRGTGAMKPIYRGRSARAWRAQAALARLVRHGAALVCAAALLALAGCASAPAPQTLSPAAPPAPAAPLSQEQAHDIAIHALGLVGTPYRYGGNTPQAGFDCSGLIGYVYRKRVGAAPPRTVAQLGAWGRPVADGELRAGDLVVFGPGRAPSHAGIYVGQGRFVHAPSSGGLVRLDSLQSGHWARQNPVFRRP